MAQVEEVKRKRGRPRRWLGRVRPVRVPVEDLDFYEQRAREMGLTDVGAYFVAVLSLVHRRDMPPELVRDLRGRDVTLPGSDETELPTAS